MVKELINIRQALNRALHAEMACDETIVCIGEDIVGGAGVDGSSGIGGVFGVTSGLADKYGRSRVIDTPISETSFVGMAVGAAMTGLKPVVEIMFCDFMGVCFDQILNQAAKTRFLSNGRMPLPMVIRTTMGAGDGSGAMHSASLHGMLASIPGLNVACPATPADAAGLLKAGLQSPDPLVLFEHKDLYDTEGLVGDDLPVVPIGKGRIAREGTDITIVAVGAMLLAAEAAASELAAHGVSAEVVDPRTIHPLDLDMIKTSVEKTGRLLVVDEGSGYIGFADGVVSAVAREAFAALKVAPQTICPLHTPVPYATHAEEKWLPSISDIVRGVKAMMDR